MRERKWLVLRIMVVTTAALVAAGCGGSNPSSPSGTRTGKLVLKGVVLGPPSASSQPGAVTALATGSGKITVTVQQNTSITTTVSSNGTFELEGVPEGQFTLVFSSTTTTTTLGTVTVPAGASQEIHIVVQVTVNVVVVVKIEIDGHEVPIPPQNHDNDD